VVKILLVCTGNTCRSPMAQAIMQKCWEDQAEGREELTVISAGIGAPNGQPASRQAMEVMAEIGIDLGNHRTMQITGSLVDDADVILTMTTAHRDYLKSHFPHRIDCIFDLKSYAGEEPGNINDPYGLGLEAYRSTRQQLQELIPKIIAKLLPTKSDEVK
jgi:protein-tyrosine-phosphatase